MAFLSGADLDFLCSTARIAGGEILDVYRTNFDVEHKADASPLTEADLRAHAVIVRNLRERYPETPLLSEEGADQAPYDVRKGWRRYFLVDPLDGTKEFVKRNGQFTVNIALIEDGRPVAGAVYAPVLDWLYYASEAGAFKETAGKAPERLGPPSPRSRERLRVVGSRSHPTPEMEAWVDRQRREYREVEFVAMGSSLKLCILAEDRADVYPRLGPTMEWDTAAAHAVAAAAGRRVLRWGTQEDLVYNKEDLLNPWFVAF
jgi:3'(2'), 5'-bisphosphate nucleotidase